MIKTSLSKSPIKPSFSSQSVSSAAKIDSKELIKALLSSKGSDGKNRSNVWIVLV